MITNRSTEKEIMDSPPTPENYPVYVDCLSKLFRVSKFVGFYRDTVKILRKFPKNSSLVDVGCGGGLFLLHLSKVFPQMHMVGTDISKEAIAEAEHNLAAWQKENPGSLATFKLQEQAKLDLPNESIDIILTTLVCHHMTDLELIDFLQSSYKAVRKAVIINDLHRHCLAEFLFSLISPLLFLNKMITHDGLISIRRSFKYKEIKILLQHANIKHYQIKWRFPFRWQIILWK